MNIKTATDMLLLRGYTASLVGTRVFAQCGDGLYLDLALETSMLAFLSPGVFAERIDELVGQSQHHVCHACGEPLLQSVLMADPGMLLYRAVEAGPLSPMISHCPRCQRELQDVDITEIDDTVLIDALAQRSRVGEAGALYGFMGWLTTRKAVSGPFSRSHEAAQAAELVHEYCMAQGWTIEDENWHTYLKPMPAEDGEEEVTDRPIELVLSEG